MPNKLATKSKIVMSFFKLMQKKHYEQITVKDICKQAQISRMTFYRNFHTKKDLVIYHLDIMYTSFLQQLLTIPNRRFYDVANVFFQLMRSDRISLQVIIDNSLDNLLRQQMKYYIQQLLDAGVFKIKGNSSELVVAMLSGAITELLITWTDGGMKEPVESLVIFVTKYVNLN